VSLTFDLYWQNRPLRVSGEVPGRGITVLMGASGAGKTTLLRALAGLDRAAGGAVRLNGETWQADEERLPAHRRRVGMVFQGAALLPGRSVAGNLNFALARARSPLLSKSEAVRATGIEALLDRPAESLSGGERQRVALARALVTDARLLVLDEPLSALDQAARQRLIAILQRLGRELAVPLLYVTHSLEETGLLADHLLYLAENRIVAAGPARPLLSDADGPFADHAHALTPVDASVVGHDEDDCLSELAWGAQRLWVPRIGAAPGDPVRLLLHARDISLALETPPDSSILNVVSARIGAWRDLGNGHCAVALDTDTGPLLARVTRRSARTLGLAPGLDVRALVKSVALPGPGEID